MIIQTISDTHNKHRNLTLADDCDLLIHAGDFSVKGRKAEAIDFLEWFAALPYKNKVLVPGNHDIWVERDGALEVSNFCKENGIDLLIDSSVVIGGIKIHGSPVTIRFGHGWAWNRDRSPIKALERAERGITSAKFIGDHWDLIPSDADIVVCHGPCQGIVDYDNNNKELGCALLRNKMKEVQPKLFVCGHIHESGGKSIKIGSTTYANTATKPMLFDWNAL